MPSPDQSGSAPQNIDVRSVRTVLAAHFAVLDRNLGDWPKLSPAEALSCLRADESAVMDHVADVLAEIRG